MFSFVCSFVCLFVVAKTARLIFTKISGNVAQGSLKELLDFGGNPDHIM